MNLYSQVAKDKPNVAKRILPTSDAKAILIALHKKHPSDEGGIKMKFDVEIAAFVTSGTNLIKVSCRGGREIPEGADFWGQAKKRTFLEGIKDTTAYHFALKLLEARKRGLEREAERASEKGLSKSTKYDTVTAKALDGFMAAVEVASVMSPVQALDLNAFMDGDLAQDLVPSEDDADDEAEYDDDVKVVNDLSVQPMTQDSTQGVKPSTSGNWWEVSSVQNVQNYGKHGANNETGETATTTTNDATGDMNGGIEYTMKYSNDDQYEIDEDIDLSEDEFGMKGSQVLENIEAEDAMRMYCKANNTVVAMENFVDTPIAKQIMADRAPYLAGLLNATQIARGDYEHDLEKHLLRRAELTPEQMQQREDNRWKTWQNFRTFCREKDEEEAIIDQAARLIVSTYGDQTPQEEEEEDEDGYDDETEDGDVEMGG